MQVLVIEMSTRFEAIDTNRYDVDLEEYVLSHYKTILMNSFIPRVLENCQDVDTIDRAYGEDNAEDRNTPDEDDITDAFRVSELAMHASSDKLVAHLSEGSTIVRLSMYTILRVLCESVRTLSITLNRIMTTEENHRQRTPPHVSFAGMLSQSESRASRDTRERDLTSIATRTFHACEDILDVMEVWGLFEFKDFLLGAVQTIHEVETTMLQQPGPAINESRGLNDVQVGVDVMPTLPQVDYFCVQSLHRLVTLASTYGHGDTASTGVATHC